MSETDALDPAPARPLWLWTLADLALLLVGFFVLIQATDRKALAQGLHEGFGGKVESIAPQPDPIPVAAAAVPFALGSAQMQTADGLADFAANSLKDPRVSLRVTGATDGSAGDVDPTSASASILAGDRARAVTAYLISRGAAADRIIIAGAATGRRGVLVTMSFTGDMNGKSK